MSKTSDYVSAMQARMKQFDKELGALGTQGLPKVPAKMRAGMQTTWETMRAALKKAPPDPGK